MGKRNVILDPLKTVGEGENPNGFTSQTANGTAHAEGRGYNQERYNWNQKADGPRWNTWPEDEIAPNMGQAVPGIAPGQKPKPFRGNRTGE